MKSLKLLVVIAVALGLGQAYADEHLGEKATDKVHDVKRGAKSKAHRLDEKACDHSDEKTKADCLAKRAANRTEEAKDAVIDKTKELKNKVD